MSKPQKVTIPKKEQKKITSMFLGKSRTLNTKNARLISSATGVSRRQVMLFLEENLDHTYSYGSYL